MSEWNPIALWFAFFVFGQMIETPIYVAFARGRAPWWRGALGGFACTTITHPLLWFVWPTVVHPWLAYAISGELITFAVESIVFYLVVRSVSLARAASSSFAANLASLLAGIIVQCVFQL